MKTNYHCCCPLFQFWCINNRILQNVRNHIWCQCNKKWQHILTEKMQNNFGNKTPLLLPFGFRSAIFSAFFLLKCVVIFCYIDIKHDFWHFAIFYRLCIRLLQIYFIAKFKEMHSIDVVKFIYSEKAIKFCEISTLLLTVTI